MQSIS